MYVNLADHLAGSVEILFSQKGSRGHKNLESANGALISKYRIDLNYAEDSTAEVDMNVVCTGSGKFIELQGTAEREPFNREQMNQMLELAEKGINQLFTIQRYALNS